MRRKKPKKIRLNTGEYALVDSEDFARLSKFRWTRQFAGKERTIIYAVRFEKIGTKKFKAHAMHREVLKLKKGDPHVDHKDHNGLNNQKSNLRTCTAAQNNQNARHFYGKSKFRGVTYKKHPSKKRKKWVARIRVNNKVIFLGGFHAENEAAEAYKKAAIKLHKEFACYER